MNLKPPVKGSIPGTVVPVATPFGSTVSTATSGIIKGATVATPGAVIRARTMSRTLPAGGFSLISPAARAHLAPIQRSPVDNLDTYDTIVLSDWPVAYWPLAFGDPTDKSGNRLHGTFTGNPRRSTMWNGSSATVFDGASYSTVSDNDLLEITRTGILTIEAWMKPDAWAPPDYNMLTFAHTEGTGYVHWFGKGNRSGIGGNQSYTGRIYSNPNLEGRVNRISGYVYNPIGAEAPGSYFQDPLTPVSWVHYTLTINAAARNFRRMGYVKIFRSGVLRDMDTLYGNDTNIAPVHPINGDAPFQVGTRDGVNSFFQGVIGKVAIYDYELEPERLVAHFIAMGSPPP